MWDGRENSCGKELVYHSLTAIFCGLKWQIDINQSNTHCVLITCGKELKPGLFCAFFFPQCNDSNWQDIKGQWAVSCSILARQCWILLRKSDTTRAHPSIGIQSRDQCYCCCPSHYVSILTDVRGKTYGAFQADGKNSVEMALHPITSVRGDCECRKECRSLCHCTARS